MKFAVIGCGSMGNRRIRHLQSVQLGEVIGYDIRPDRMREVQAKYGIRTLQNVDEVLSENPTALFICVPPAEHLFYLKLAAESGWHFMTENPISHSLEGLRGLRAQIIDKNLVTHISTNMRFHAGIKELKRLLLNGAIGKCLTGIIEIGEWLPDWHPYEPYTDYYPSRKSMGGGLDAICDLEWISDIFGDVARIACLASTRSSLNIDTDDVVQILIEYVDGPQIIIHSDMIQRSYSHRAKFIGERGTITWDAIESSISLFEAESKEWKSVTYQMDQSVRSTEILKPGWDWVEPMYFNDSKAFLDRIQSGECSLDSFDEAVENLRLILGALECSRNNMVLTNR